jgi:uncharacterized protein YceK
VIWLCACLIALLSGCASCLKDFEQKNSMYEIDVQHQICGRYQIVDPLLSKYVWIEDLPLSACDGFFALRPDGLQAAVRCAAKSAKECQGGN